VIQASIVLICADVKQARGFELLVEHSSGIRAFEQPLTEAFTIWLMTLIEVSLGTISFLDLQADIAPEPAGIPLTMRAYRPESFFKFVWAVPSWHPPVPQLLPRIVATAEKVAVPEEPPAAEPPLPVLPPDPFAPAAPTVPPVLSTPPEPTAPPEAEPPLAAPPVLEPPLLLPPEAEPPEPEPPEPLPPLPLPPEAEPPEPEPPEPT